MLQPKIEHTALKRCDLLKLSGRFDSSFAPQLDAQFAGLTDRGRYHFVLDMSDLEFISSANLRVLLATHKQMRRWNRGDIYLAEVPERIASVLELAGVASLFRVYDTTTAAIGDW